MTYLKPDLSLLNKETAEMGKKLESFNHLLELDCVNEYLSFDPETETKKRQDDLLKSVCMLEKDDVVQVVGLKSKPHWNNKIGILLGEMNPKTNRLPVQIFRFKTGGNIKKKNLKIVWKHNLIPTHPKCRYQTCHSSIKDPEKHICQNCYLMFFCNNQCKTSWINHDIFICNFLNEYGHHQMDVFKIYKKTFNFKFLYFSQTCKFMSALNKFKRHSLKSSLIPDHMNHTVKNWEEYYKLRNFSNNRPMHKQFYVIMTIYGILVHKCGLKPKKTRQVSKLETVVVHLVGVSDECELDPNVHSLYKEILYLLPGYHFIFVMVGRSKQDCEPMDAGIAYPRAPKHISIRGRRNKVVGKMTFKIFQTTYGLELFEKLPKNIIKPIVTIGINAGFDTFTPTWFEAIRAIRMRKVPKAYFTDYTIVNIANSHDVLDRGCGDRDKFDLACEVNPFGAQRFHINDSGRLAFGKSLFMFGFDKPGNWSPRDEFYRHNLFI